MLINVCCKSLVEQHDRWYHLETREEAVEERVEVHSALHHVWCSGELPLDESAAKELDHVEPSNVWTDEEKKGNLSSKKSEDAEKEEKEN